MLSESTPGRYDDRRQWAYAQAASLRAERRKQLQSDEPQAKRVRPLALLDALDLALERLGGGIITTEQFATPLDCMHDKAGGGANTYLGPVGGSEGCGIGAVLGAKLAAPDRSVVGLVGDGSMYYADSGLWTAVHHGIPVLYLIANNGTYGIVADFFGKAQGTMTQSGDYAGVVLDGIDPVKIASGYGVEGQRVEDEATIGDVITDALETVEREKKTALPARCPSAHRATAGRASSGPLPADGCVRRRLAAPTSGKPRPDLSKYG